MLWIVRLRRKSRKITLREMSKLTLMTVNTISNIEKNPNNAKIGDLKNICKVLDLDISEVVKSIN